MTVEKEIQFLADTIVKNHQGQAFFNFGEAGKIMGCGRNAVGELLHTAGVTVKEKGSAKLVSAYGIATAMLTDRISPIRRR